jgi:antirestriction protein ArdC
MKTTEIYEATTAAIVTQMEQGAGDWEMPWTTGRAGFPTNAVTGRRYKGGNVLTLWGTALQKGHASGAWASYKQWSSIGAQVRSGERGTKILFWSQITKSDEEETGERRWVARHSTVFNAAQVDGYQAAVGSLNETERLEQADRFFTSVRARVEHRPANVPHYRPEEDLIVLPPFADFRDAEAYYATTAHEHAHWTGHRDRLGRDLTSRFGTDGYAMEELVAELSAAFTCAALEIAPEPRPDHSAYLQHWLSVLRSDPKALHHVAGRAQAATDHLLGLHDAASN